MNIPPILSFGSAVALACQGCGPGTPPAKIPEISGPSHVSTPAGVSFSTVCTPTGPEICFNAVDDNCNGVFDEGCGMGTGVLQWEIAWGDSPAEMELVVTDPAGDRLTDANRSTPSGLHLDHVCPRDGCHGQNVDNVYFEGHDPPAGHYAVEVKLVDPKGATLPLKVQFGWKVGGRSSATELSIASPDDKKEFSFEL
jgi:tRNA (guanosine-2'-O-)-methyltransferase